VRHHRPYRRRGPHELIGRDTPQSADGEEAAWRAAWKTELAPDFHDRPGWRPPAGAPGQLPFHAELWQSDDHRVVLFTDRD
jgi:hypothetical protein